MAAQAKDEALIFSGVKSSDLTTRGRGAWGMWRGPGRRGVCHRGWKGYPGWDFRGDGRVRLLRGESSACGGGGLAQGLGIRSVAFGGAYWPLATAHSDPLWAPTCFGCGGGGEGVFKGNKQMQNGTSVTRRPGKTPLCSTLGYRSGAISARAPQCLGTHTNRTTRTCSPRCTGKLLTRALRRRPGRCCARLGSRRGHRTLGRQLIVRDVPGGHITDVGGGGGAGGGHAVPHPPPPELWRSPHAPHDSGKSDAARVFWMVRMGIASHNSAHAPTPPPPGMHWKGGTGPPPPPLPGRPACAQPLSP